MTEASGGGEGGTTVARTLDLSEERLRSGLIALDYGGLSSVLGELALFVNTQSKRITQLEAALATTRDELVRETARATEREAKLEAEINSIRAEAKAMATEESIVAFRYDTERRLHELDEASTKTAEAVAQAQEEVRNISGEVAQITGEQDGLRSEIGRVAGDLPELRDELTRAVDAVTGELHQHVADMSVHATPEAMAQHAAAAASAGGGIGSPEELREAIREELSGQATATDAKLAQALQRLEDATADLDAQISAALESKLQLVTPLEMFERFRHDLERLKLGDVVKQIKALAKSQSRLQADLKMSSEALESESHKLERCRETVDQKADQAALEELAKFVLSKLKEISERGGGTPQQATTPSPEAATTPSDTQLLERISATTSTASVAASAALQGELEALRDRVSKLGDAQKLLLERIDKTNETNTLTQNKVTDVRRDLFELGQLVEALSTEMKTTKEHLRSTALNEKEAGVATEVSSQIERLSQQFSEVLKKKADLLTIEQMIQEREEEHRQELDGIQQAVQAKAGQEELLRLKRNIEKDLRRALMQSSQAAQHQHELLESVEDGSSTALGRGHYRCVACDRPVDTLSRVPDGTSAGGFFDLAPNVAYKRWIVRDMVRAAKEKEQREAVAAAAGSPAATTTAGAGSKPKKVGGTQTRTGLPSQQALQQQHSKRPSSSGAGAQTLPPLAAGSSSSSSSIVQQQQQQTQARPASQPQPQDIAVTDVSERP